MPVHVSINKPAHNTGKEKGKRKNIDEPGRTITPPGEAHLPVQRKPLCACEGGCPRCQPGRVMLKTDMGNNEQAPVTRLGEQAAESAPEIEGMTPEPEPTRPPSKNLYPESALPSGLTPFVHTAGGSPLPETARNYFESRLGRDFSGVRVHHDDLSRSTARGLAARAFTYRNHIVFNKDEYAPATGKGSRLLAHELAHVIQQEKNQTPYVQCAFDYAALWNKIDQNNPLPSGQIDNDPITFFYPGTTVDKKKALVIAGIHGNEASAKVLGKEAQKQLAAGLNPKAVTRKKPFYHTILIPEVNTGKAREAGSGKTLVPDLNREFGTGYASVNPLAAYISDIINKYKPERVLSIHSISNAQSSGIFLDPLHARQTSLAGGFIQILDQYKADKKNPNRPTPKFAGYNIDPTFLTNILKKIDAGTLSIAAAADLLIDKVSYPPIGTAQEKKTAFAGEQANYQAMELTEEMIMAAEKKAAAQKAGKILPGNQATANWPGNEYPGTAGTPKTSAYNLLYVLQGTVTGNAASLGEWLSGNGVPVITLEVPISAKNIDPYLEAVWKFLGI